MYEQRFVKELLEALQNEDVIRELISIFKNNAMDSEYTSNKESSLNLKEALYELQNKEKIYIQKLAESQQIIGQLNAQLKTLLAEKNKIELEKDDLQCQISTQQKAVAEKDIKIEILSKRFAEPEHYYQIYQQLSERIKFSLNGIFKGNTLDEFVFCGIQFENIESLWEFIKVEVMEHRLTEVTDLIKIFTYFFNSYNLTHESPLYEIQRVKIGEKFDEDKYIRSVKSHVSGNVSEIMLTGYINTKTKRIVKKSIVRI